MRSKEKALIIAATAAEKKGADIRVLDLRELASFTDFFVVMSATSNRHAKTLADTVVEASQAQGERPLGIEGEQTARWILVDLGDVVVHVFQQEARDFYSLERLWGEAESVAVPKVAAGIT